MRYRLCRTQHRISEDDPGDRFAHLPARTTREIVRPGAPRFLQTGAPPGLAVGRVTERFSFHRFSRHLSNDLPWVVLAGRAWCAVNVVLAGRAWFSAKTMDPAAPIEDAGHRMSNRRGNPWEALREVPRKSIARVKNSIPGRLRGRGATIDEASSGRRVEGPPGLSSPGDDWFT